MPIAATALEGGFRDTVFGAQSTFRAVMEALARPGIAQPVPDQPSPPQPLSPAAGALALTLCDFDTPLWLDATLTAHPLLVEWLGVQTGATVVREPANAAFAFVADPRAMPPLAAFAQGTQEYPDRSTTIVIEADAFDGGEPLALTGPGVDGSVGIAPHPLPSDLVEQLAANRAAFPRGVDLILVAGGRLLGLPRSTHVRRP